MTTILPLDIRAVIGADASASPDQLNISFVPGIAALGQYSIPSPLPMTIATVADHANSIFTSYQDALTYYTSQGYPAGVLADVNLAFVDYQFTLGAITWFDQYVGDVLVTKQDKSTNLDQFAEINLAPAVKTMLQSTDMAGVANALKTPLISAMALNTAAFQPATAFAPAYAGSSSQYVKGDGSMATFPSIPAAQIQSDWNQSSTSALDYIKNKPSINTTRTPSTFTLNVSGTGATGTQVSATKDSSVRVTYMTSTTSTLAGSNTSIVTTKVCPTNSATESDWITYGETSSRQPSGISVIVGQVISQSGQVCVDVPAGYYVKAVNSGTGTHSETFLSGQKTIYG